MQDYLQLQNKLRKELSNRWVEYFQVDGLSKQKGNSIKFTPSTALQGIMYEISQQLGEMEQSLSTKFPNETDNQKLERNKMHINDKFSKLVEQHKNATKNGILGKDETWAKLINRYPDLKAFVKKYGHLRANESILNSLSDDPEDYRTNREKANLALEYESAEFNDIAKFIKKQEEQIRNKAQQKKDDERLRIADDRNRQLQIEQNQQQRMQNFGYLPALEYYNEGINDDEEEYDDAETVASREPRNTKPKPKTNNQATTPPKSKKKETNKHHAAQVTGKKSRPSTTPDNSDDYENQKQQKKINKEAQVEEVFDDDNKNGNDDDDEPQVTTISRTQQAKLRREQQQRDEEKYAELRGFETVRAMKQHDQKEKSKERASERYHSLNKEGRQKIRDQQNANNAKKRAQTQANKNGNDDDDDQHVPNTKQTPKYRNKDPFYDYDDEWDEGTPKEGFWYENDFVRPLQPLDLQTYVPHVTTAKNRQFKAHTEKESKKAMKELKKVSAAPYGLDDVEEYVHKNPDVKNALETLEGLGKRGKKNAAKGKGKKPEPMKTTTKKHNNTQNTTQAPKQVTFSTQLPAGITNN